MTTSRARAPSPAGASRRVLPIPAGPSTPTTWLRLAAASSCRRGPPGHDVAHGAGPKLRVGSMATGLPRPRLRRRRPLPRGGSAEPPFDRREPRYPRGTGGCRAVRIGAAGCGMCATPVCRNFGSASGVAKMAPTATVRKGSPVRVRQGALRNRATARFSRFRSGSADPFRAVPSEKGSSVAADGRCAAAGRPAERISFSAKVPTRYTAGVRISVATALGTVGLARPRAVTALNRSSERDQGDGGEDQREAAGRGRR